jgi:hypothetical protein
MEQKNNNNFRLKNVIIYNSWFDAFENRLTDEQVGKLMKAIGRWKNGQDLISDDTKVEGMLILLEKDLNDMVEEYNRKCEINRENGKKGGRPNKTQHNPENPLGYLETQMVLAKPTLTQPNPENLKEKEIEMLITSKEVINHNTNSDFSHLGGYGKFLGNFPPSKVRDIEDGKELWDTFSQEEKQEVIRHSTKYIHEMNTKGQVQYMKNSLSYLMEEPWLKMKTRSLVQKPVERGMLNMTFISYWSKSQKIDFDEAQKFLYRTSTDEQFKKAHKEYNDFKNQNLIPTK